MPTVRDSQDSRLFLSQPGTAGGKVRMPKNYPDILKKRLDAENHVKLMVLQNVKLHRFVADSILLCDPDHVFVCTDSSEDIAYIRAKSIETGEFAAGWRKEADGGQHTLNAQLAEERRHPIEKVGEQVRALMKYLKETK